MPEVVGASLASNFDWAGPLSVSVPAGDTGDYLLAIFFHRNGGTPSLTLPSGFDVLGSRYGEAGVVGATAAGKEADGEEGGSLAFDASVGDRAVALYRLRGYDPELMAVSLLAAVNTLNPPTPAVTTPADNSLVISAMAAADASRFGTPDGFLGREDADPSIARWEVVSAYMTQASAGSSGAVIWDDSDEGDPEAGEYMGATVAVAPMASEPEGPTITSHPSNDEVTAPDPGSFSVSATGEGTLSYQWQVDDGEGWENVSTGTGGTTDSYTTGATTVEMDGYEFRCVVTDDNDSTESNAATLTVNAAAAVVGLRFQLISGGAPVANEADIAVQIQDGFPLGSGAIVYEGTVSTDANGVVTIDMSELDPVPTAEDKLYMALLSDDEATGRVPPVWVVEDINDAEANSLVEPEV